MKFKTYGIRGLSEWQGDVKVGSIKMRLHFTGGTASPSGAQPAYFATSDPLTQFVIENSKEYGSLITLLSSRDVEGEHPREAKSTPTKPDPVTAYTPSPAPVYDNGADGANGRGPDDGITVRSVDVPDKAAAIEWLKENHPEKGYTTTRLTRSKEEFNNACAECGVVFNIG